MPVIEPSEFEYIEDECRKLLLNVHGSLEKTKVANYGKSILGKSWSPIMASFLRKSGMRGAKAYGLGGLPVFNKSQSPRE